MFSHTLHTFQMSTKARVFRILRLLRDWRACHASTTYIVPCRLHISVDTDSDRVSEFLLQCIT